MKHETENQNQLDERLIQIRPDRRQIEFQKTEFYGFVHFTVNTFTDKEWGDGTENPAIFNPKKLDAVQWVNAIKSAGMKGLILTCKHHDGFCLWPSAYTKHTIAASPYKNGNGDIVKEVAVACALAGIKFGVYLSPWDRNSTFYGQGEVYDTYFVNQLTELLTNYGPVFTVWFDGACGEGKNGKKQYYDWDRYYETVRRLQPDACINVCGPDIRWCGNEAGDTRESEWSIVPERMRNCEMITSKSQQIADDDLSFRTRKIASSDSDLGSRIVLQEEEQLVWYPAEVNISIRPGWFFHEEENSQVRSLTELSEIYFHSVGANSTFLLNIPPNREGLFDKEDCNRLQELGDFLRNTFACNLLDQAEIYSDYWQTGYEIENARTPGYDICFKTEDGQASCMIDVIFPERTLIRYVVLQENITLSQRIEKFDILAEIQDEIKEVYCGTIVGYKKIAQLSEVYTKHLQIRILDSRISVTLAFLGIY